MEVQLLVAELKRRRVIRALVAYGILAFAILQVIEPLMHGLRWSDSVLSNVIVALAAGFPAVAILAWIYDVNAWRIERATPSTNVRGGLLAAVLVAIGVLAAAPGLFVYFVVLGGRAPVRGTQSIAVLPFVNMSAEKENEYFSDGITEEVIDALANVDGLRVASRTSAFTFKGKDVAIPAIAETLNVAYVLEGSVRRSGNDVRVVAQLIEAGTGYHIWSRTYEREVRNIFEVENELARSIAQALKPRLLPMTASLVPARTQSVEAHDLYLQGRFLWNQRTPAALKNATALFEHAIERDDKFALAHVGLCESLIVLPAYGWISVPEVLPRSSAAAMNALEINPESAEAHSCLCLVRVRSFDWRSAEQECRRAIELRPDYGTAHQWYAIMLHSVGRVSEALAEARRAQQLEPRSAVINNFVTMELYLGRSYDAALAEGLKTLQLDQKFSLAHSFLALTYLQLHRDSDALGELEPLAGQSYRYDGERGYAYGISRRRDDALRLLAQMEERSRREYVAPSARALVHIGLGDNAEALSWLEKGYSELDWRLIYLKSDPLFDPLRGDPRFHAILRRMHVE
ncbi:MAG: hypothetical protein ABR567_01035 [Myxococcales bacterium]|nr:hypothetical protein [Myxococcales bacterium]